MKLKFVKRLIGLSVLVLLAGCSGSSQQGAAVLYPTGLPNGQTLSSLSGNNVLPLTVNGSTCAANSYLNKPCVNIQICSSNSTSDCITLKDMLVDTGSVGIRVFKSLVTNLNFQQVQDNNNKDYAECVTFGDGSQDWGPVQKANVVLEGEAPVQIPIQVIDSSYPGKTQRCPNATTTPAEAGYNGIFGVGLKAQDCGTDCATGLMSNPAYYVCSAGTCSRSTVPLAKQLANPVNELSQDNNGLILQLPMIPFGGTTSVDGYIVLGIGTQANNIPSGVQAYSADPNQSVFSTTFNDQTLSSSFIDSGTNTYAFPSTASLPGCSGQLVGFFCPSSLQSLTARTTAFSGGTSTDVGFYIDNAFNLFTSSNHSVYLEVGANSSGYFDWGLPFFLGRNVYVGFEGKSSSLASGTYWAY